MSVYTNATLTRQQSGELGVAGYGFLYAYHLQVEQLAGWNPQFTLRLSTNVFDPDGVYMEESHNNDVFLILQTFYGDGFERELLIAPDYQHLKCLWMKKRIKDDEGRLSDISVVRGHQSDCFCIVGKRTNKFFIVNDGSLAILERSSFMGLDDVATEYQNLTGRSLLPHLKKENFNNKMWCEVLPSFARG